MDSSGKRAAVVVLGMHRSGTSAASGFIHLLGADTPANVHAPNDFNLKGYWESTSLLQFNDQLLQSIGSDWRDWSRIEAKRLDPAATREAQLAELIQAEFGDSSLFVLKDP